MTVSLDQFGKAYAAAGLITPDELKQFWSTLSAQERPKTGEAFAQRLVERGKLTAFQAAELLAGRGSSLMMEEYVITDELGAGGMGKVYKARHGTMQRTVALKVMSQAAMTDEAAVKRFQREVRAAARLEHPNIVTAYDSGRVGNASFLVMQFVDGGDLSSLVKKRGPLEVGLAVEYVCQAAQGLAYAHGVGVIHRDIKPANLLIDKRGVVKILDLGLARIDDAQAGEALTATEQVMGTVDYMAPEQATDSKHVDGRADIYALGCTLWYLLTGKRMYDGETMIIRLMKHRDAPLPSLVKARDDVPWSLEQVFHKMVAKAPQDRYGTMDEVLEALELHRPARGSGSKADAGSSIGEGATEHSAELSAFFKTVGPGAAAKSASSAGSTQAGFRAAEATLVPGNADREAEPSPARSTTTPRPGEAAALRSPAGRSSGPPQRVIVGGIAACAALVLGAVLFFARSGNNEAPKAAAIPAEANTLGEAAPAAARTAPPPAVAPFDATQARRHRQAWSEYLGLPMEFTNSLGMTFALIPPGEFLMGSSNAEIDAQLKLDEERVRNDSTFKSNAEAIRSEGPQHRVTITKPFYLGAAEVTTGEFRKFVEATNYRTSAELAVENGKIKNLTWKSRGSESLDDLPVQHVSWNDAVEFCNWLSSADGKHQAYQSHPTLGMILDAEADGYRLPFEAEWEYACRAGTTTAYFWGREEDSESIQNYVARGQQPALRRRPNPFDLFDMIGNVEEWCQDEYDPFYYGLSPPQDPPGGRGPGRGKRVRHVVRGQQAGYTDRRSAVRNGEWQDSHNVRGFRMVLPIRSARAFPQPSPLASTAKASPAATSSAPAGAATSTAASFYVPPVVPPGNYALSFAPYGAGTGAFEIPGWKYTGDTPLTIEAWITSRRSGFHTFFGSAKQGPGISVLQQLDGTWRFGMTDQYLVEIRTNEPVPLMQRTHFALLYDRYEVRMFLNGAEQNAVRKASYAPSPFPFFIGASPDKDGRPANSGILVLDEVRISRVVRYRSQFKPAERLEPDVDTEALYHFDEGTGDTARDASSHGRHVRLSDAAWVNLDGSPIKPLPASP